MEAALKRPWLLRGTVIGLALVVGLIALIASGGDSGDEGEEAVPAATETRIVGPAELADAEATLGHPVYWAGPIAGTEIELTESEDGSTQVRYLEDAAEAGTESPDALTIGSYPLEDPAAALNAFATEADSVLKRAKRGGEVVFSRSNPNSVYFVAPDNSVQVEVYDPRPARALKLALAERVGPAG